MHRKLTVVLTLCGMLLAPPALMAEKTAAGKVSKNPFDHRAVGGGSISIDKIDGLVADGQIQAGKKITFHLRFTNKTGLPVAGFANGFRVYSPDGATWGTTVADTTGLMPKGLMDGGMFITTFGISGSGADTVGFGGFRILKDGLPDGWSDVPATITIGPIPASMVGKTVCLDQSFFPPGGYWLWSLEDQVENEPDFGGPYCFKIVK
ncbi:MAG TPA: hypothetical protein PLR32_00550 [candidate division Zixibacteria bacterium]|nr:hypothetical protein [candidate division Zixibacteria bacterium]MDD4917625.1 hypothetical protein [candidate division Zixibacteria bacterium]MDM7972116.1 hypothetical protein [candidate division Zixibacteria bacterium]HOD66770.1 hypothetical protein [candidate division Zixibacteria bacterium]HPI31774.1 hypothetical protein [candidate division Zixibacteria bacterium]